MGQKANPLILRNKIYPGIWSQKIIDCQLLRGLLIDYFRKKGFYVNFLNIYLINNELLLNVSLLTSRKSVIFNRKFRRFLRKKRFIYSKKNIGYFKKKYSHFSYLGIHFFLNTVAKHYFIKNVFINFRRLEINLYSKKISAIWNGIKKYTSFSYRRNPYVLDLILASSYIISGEGSSFLINQILVSFFSRMSKRQHRRFLLFLKNFFKVICDIDKSFNNCLFGIKFLVSGKISGKTRSKMFESNSGRIPCQSISVPIEYSFLPSYTLMGVFGFKVWLAKKPKNQSLLSKYNKNLNFFNRNKFSLFINRNIKTEKSSKKFLYNNNKSLFYS